MSHRELKRVPMDFDWPLKKTWRGYICPYRSIECAHCSGSGLNSETKKLSNDWYSHLRTDGKEGWMHHLEQEDVQALIDRGRLFEFVRVPKTDEQRQIIKDGKGCWLPFNNGYIPTAEEINNWSRTGIGHDSINQWICVEARAKRLGFYGLCKHCDGDGALWNDENHKKLHEEWERSEPPIGEGYQMWETCSEGSPVTPVFESLDKLCDYIVENKVSWFGRTTASKEDWMSALSEGYAGTMIATKKVEL